MRFAVTRLLPAFALCLFAGGCGYHFTGTTSYLPPEIHSLSIGEITNETREPGLEKSLAFALEREVLRRGVYRLEERPGGGDAVVSGRIRSVQLRPVSFNSKDEALQYEVALEVDLQLRQSSDGHILWAVEGLRETDEYGAIARVIVTSSSQFQRGTLEPRDLREFTDVQLAESGRRQALRRVLDSVARSAYSSMVERF